MAIIGLVRLTGDASEVEVQHDVLDPMCERVFEEAATRRRLTRTRPQLLAALNDLGHDDLLAVTKVRYLAQTSIDGLEVLTDLVDQGVPVRVLFGMAAGDHVEGSFFLDQSREIVEIRRRILTDNIKAGLRAARERGAALGRPRAVVDAKSADIVSRREQGQSLRSIARAVEVSLGTAHNVLAVSDRFGGVS